MFSQKEKETHFNIPLIIISTFIIFYTLYIWASFVIPFIISILFSFAIIWVSNFYQNFKIPKFVSMILSLITYLLIFWLFWELINSNIDELIKKLPYYQDKINLIINNFFDFALNQKILEWFWLWWAKDINIFESVDFAEIAKNTLGWISSVFSNTGMIFFYTLFILLEYRYFWDKLSLMVIDKEKRKNISATIYTIKNDIKAYFIIKSIVSFITALLSYFIMLLFWLDFAIFWAFLIFILNFIPNIGSIIALIFPITISLIQYEQFYPFVIITSWLIWIQIFMWNIIEPKFMGNKLNLSPLAIIISLSFWWALWSIVWMLLSVPIMVIINIILAKIPETRPIAILLSEKWELKIESDEEIIKTRKKILSKIRHKILK